MSDFFFGDRLNVHTFNIKPEALIAGKLALARGLKVGCEGIGLMWLSRFKLIRLRRISLATLPRFGLMDGYQYIAPASGRWSHSLREKGRGMGGWVGLQKKTGVYRFSSLMK